MIGSIAPGYSGQKSFSRNNAGFTYIGLLILIAIMGVTLAGIGTVWSTTQQRLKEQQLLFVGKQFSRAITAYYSNSPGGVQQFPKKLEDLLLDKRYPNIERYLRKIFDDPMTGKHQWGLIMAADGSIIGVHSLSELTPIKTENFGKDYENFANKKHYSEWQFVYRPNIIAPPAQNTAPAKVTDNPAQSPAMVPSTTPPLPPTPANTNVPPRLQNLCQITYGTDVQNCSGLGDKFGDAAKTTCLASANQRYLSCMGNNPSAGMPALDVQYQ